MGPSLCVCFSVQKHHRGEFASFLKSYNNNWTGAGLFSLLYQKIYKSGISFVKISPAVEIVVLLLVQQLNLIFSTEKKICGWELKASYAYTLGKEWGRRSIPLTFKYIHLKTWLAWIFNQILPFIPDKCVLLCLEEIVCGSDYLWNGKMFSVTHFVFSNKT